MKNDIKAIKRLLETKSESIENLQADLLKQREKAENTLKHIDFSDLDTSTKEYKKREAESDLKRIDKQLSKIDNRLRYEQQKQQLTDYKFERSYDKLEQEAIIEDFKSLIIDDINTYSKVYSITDVLASIPKSDNIITYIKQLQHDFNYKTRNDYVELFYKAFNSVKRLYNQDLLIAKANLQRKVKRRKQRLINNLFATTSYLAINRWANSKTKRW